jgi:hypothetical protein
MLSRTNKQTHLQRQHKTRGERKKERKKHDMGGERLHGWRKVLIDDHGDELTFCQGSKLEFFFCSFHLKDRRKLASLLS